jgi:hypothetical protein
MSDVFFVTEVRQGKPIGGSFLKAAELPNWMANCPFDELFVCAHVERLGVHLLPETEEVLFGDAEDWKRRSQRGHPSPSVKAGGSLPKPR